MCNTIPSLLLYIKLNFLNSELRVQFSAVEL
jgi:hypothetical protein